MTDAEYIATIPAMNLEELFALVMSEPAFLTDGYYRKFRDAICLRYDQLLTEKEKQNGI